MVEILLLAGLAVAVFVGFNIGGSSTGVAFGPAVGSGTIGKLLAAGLMTGFALLGGWTVGRNVVETMGGQIVPAAYFTLAASVGILFFVGLALLVSNLFGVPASTSMTAVGAIAGLGVATGSIDWAVMGRIVVWWLVAPILAWWICAVIGRYLYPYMEASFAIDRSDGPLFETGRVGPVPVPRPGPGTTRRELVGSLLVVAIACYMAFSAGASNVANAVAPLVGNGAISMNAAILLAAGAIGLGAFTIARRTLATVGTDLTDLPILAALVVEVVSATLITFLSTIGIPASLAVSATMCIVGLGWGRATRTATVRDIITGEGETRVTVDALTTEESADTVGGGGDHRTDGTEPTGNAGTDRQPVPRIGEEDAAELTANDLFDPRTTGRVVTLWILTPSLAAIASYAVFEYLPLFGF